MKAYDATEGIVTVMNAETGEVLNVSCIGMAGDQSQLLDTPMRTTLFSTFALETSMQTGRVSSDDIVKTGNGKKKIQGRKIYDHNWKRGGYGKINVKQGFALNSYIAMLLAVNKAFDSEADYAQAVNNSYKITPKSIFFYDYELSPMKIMSLYRDLSNSKNARVWKAIDYDRESGFASNVFKDMDLWGKFCGLQVSSEDYFMEVCGIYPMSKPKYIIYVRMNKKSLPCSGAMAAEVLKDICARLQK
jgi:cell division protein FtsI (penicillin-binding protein 3)